MNLFRSFRRWSTDMGRVFRNEWSLVLGDVGVILFFFILPLAYPIVYTLIYNPEVVEKMPVAIVDNCRSAESREFAFKADACPAIKVYSFPADMAEARSQMAAGDIFGIIEIPSSYARDLATGQQTHIQFYAEMSLLLRYRSFLSALTDLQMELVGEQTAEKIEGHGLGSLAVSGMPVKSHSNFLGDTEQGFASFVIPGIVILILQQSMILGINMICGTSRERRRRNGGIDPKAVNGVSASATVWGKTLCYLVCYIPVTLYILRFIPEIFNLPHYGSPADYLLFIFPMLLASAVLGQTLNYFMKERESAFIIIVFTSVVFLFLSGLTWPRYAMSPLWLALGDLVPGVWGVEGFIRINSNAASLAETATAFKAMWILAAVYMLSAFWVTAYIDAREKRRATEHAVETDKIATH